MVPDEKNTTTGSDGWTEAAHTKTSAGSTPRPPARRERVPAFDRTEWLPHRRDMAQERIPARNEIGRFSG